MVNEDKKYSISEVFNLIDEKYLTGEDDLDKGDHSIEVDGFQVYSRSLRYMTFYQKGVKCACCGKEGAYFQLTGEPGTNRRHFNLYAEDGTLMTKDHIIPRSKGGQDKISNMQTMCVDCNKAKGNQYDGDGKPLKEYIIATNNSGYEMCFSTLHKAVFHLATHQHKLLSKKTPKEECLKGAVTCVLKLQAAINNDIPYGGYIWKTEWR